MEYVINKVCLFLLILTLSTVSLTVNSANSDTVYIDPQLVMSDFDVVDLFDGISGSMTLQTPDRCDTSSPVIASFEKALPVTSQLVIADIDPGPLI